MHRLTPHSYAKQHPLNLQLQELCTNKHLTHTPTKTHSTCSCKSCALTNTSINLQLEELRRRAEADKLAALSALEEKSQQFMREKQEKRLLERRLHSMSSQLLIGGADADTRGRARARAHTHTHMLLVGGAAPLLCVWGKGGRWLWEVLHFAVCVRVGMCSCR